MDAVLKVSIVVGSIHIPKVFLRLARRIQRIEGVARVQEAYVNVTLLPYIDPISIRALDEDTSVLSKEVICIKCLADGADRVFDSIRL